MTLYFRETDAVSGRWTANVSAPLTPAQFDETTYTLEQAIAAVAATVTASRSVSSITQTGNALTFNMSDSTMEGPFTIDPAVFVDRGTWAPSTFYAVNDTFSINGTLYRVPFAHTSASTFSAGANDGMGHNYYAAMISTPGASLPTGGATGQVLQKSSGSDFAVTWGNKTPTGGSARQYLIKINGTQDNAAWSTPTATDIAFVPSTGSALTATNVSDAIEEAALTGGAGATTLESLTDVSIPTAGPNVGDLFSFTSPDWSNVPQSTLSLSFTQLTDLPSIVQLRDTTVTALGSISGTVSVDPDLGNVFTITPTGGVTLDAANTRLGAEIILIVQTAGTSSFNLTPSTNFISQGALATGTVNAKNFVMRFVSDGTVFYEASRTAAM